MLVSLGDRLGPYEILACLGKGGMGEVYSARDTRLDRDVAIKVSQERFTERFEREARAIAVLNHPNVCHLYDVDPNYLVMELVDGPTLAERLKQGAIPLDEALNIARQIADALEAAHEKGIVHRDLKPGNIKIRPDGTVKVLDFGLAKMGGTPAVQGEHSPTQTVGPTEAGMILGTAGYMSPEQARGKPVDQRADIYAFGVVLYEMLAGERLHHGDTTTEILASVIKEEPQWDKVPAQVQRLLRRCLEKDPNKRLRHIGDVMALVNDAPIAPIAVAAKPVRGNRWFWPMAVAAGVLVGAVLAFLYLRPKATAAAAVQRFEISVPEQISGLGQRSGVSVSPDGKLLVFSHLGSPTANGLWVRRLDSVGSRLIDGTEGAFGVPFWSPDSRFIAFGATDGLKRIEPTGGLAQILAADVGLVYGGFWTADGRIVFSSGNNSGSVPDLWEIPAGGGVTRPLSSVEHPGNVGMSSPILLPDGRHFIYVRTGQIQDSSSGIYLESLDAKLGPHAKKLLNNVSDVVYASSPDPDRGYLLFIRGGSATGGVGSLLVQPFDLRKLDLVGEPVQVAEETYTGGVSVSQTGVLAYLADAVAVNRSQLTWFDREGKNLGTVGDPGVYQSIAISPDGTRVVANRVALQSGDEDLWVFNPARGVSTRFTFNGNGNRYPVWSPDGSRVVFRSVRNGSGDLYEKLSNGGGDEELLFKSDRAKLPISWSPDGRFLLFATPGSGLQSWVLPLDRQAHASGKPYVFLNGDVAGKFSPDMRWIAYSSAESGKYEVYVRPFDPNSANGSPSGGGKWQVSTGGGGAARWNANGKELFYLASDGATVMVVDVAASPVFQPGTPRVLFKASGLPARPASGAAWDASPDGKKFLMPIPVAANAAAAFNVVLNWTSSLKK
jgi:Tol biopolymer transport system component/predicted Ser/Thr protein kinase